MPAQCTTKLGWTIVAHPLHGTHSRLFKHLNLGIVRVAPARRQPKATLRLRNHALDTCCPTLTCLIATQVLDFRDWQGGWAWTTVGAGWA